VTRPARADPVRAEARDTPKGSAWARGRPSVADVSVHARARDETNRTRRMSTLPREDPKA
jgi:hypothetical protein